MTSKMPTKFTPAALRAWQTRMGYTQRDAAEALDCSRGAYGKWRKTGSHIPRYIGLACAALALGMTAYGAAPSNPTRSEGTGK